MARDWRFRDLDIMLGVVVLRRESALTLKIGSATGSHAAKLASGPDPASGLDVQHGSYDNIMPNHGSDGRSPKLDGVPVCIQTKIPIQFKRLVSRFSARQ